MTTTDHRTAFLGWQCRVRQYAIRMHGGRPTPGMRPKLLLRDAGQSNRVVVLINKADTKQFATQFHHMARKTQDPADRYDAAIKLLSATYYQKPDSFRDELTAVFGVDSEFAKAQEAEGHCVLDFQQHGQRFVVPCATRSLEPETDLFESSYWHNFLFNPGLPGQVRILCYHPQWDQVEYSERQPDPDEAGSAFFP